MTSRLNEIKAKYRYLFSAVVGNFDWQKASAVKADLLEADVPALVAAVEAVLELHQRNRYDECIECLSTDEYGEATNVDYPCPTVAAIRTALGEGEK